MLAMSDIRTGIRNAYINRYQVIDGKNVVISIIASVISILITVFITKGKGYSKKRILFTIWLVGQILFAPLFIYEAVRCTIDAMDNRYSC